MPHNDANTTEPPIDANERRPSPRTLHGLDWLNFFLADVQTGVGPFIAIYLAASAWNEQSVGLALTVAGIAGIATAVGIGASLSNWIAGAIVHHAGYNAGFLLLSAIAAGALGLLWTMMPETKDRGEMTEREAAEASTPGSSRDAPRYSGRTPTADPT